MKNKGFTLIELLVTIAIISLLASIVFASVSSAREKTQFVKAQVQGTELGKAIELGRLSNGSLPVNTSSDAIVDLDENSEVRQAIMNTISTIPSVDTNVSDPLDKDYVYLSDGSEATDEWGNNLMCGFNSEYKPSDYIIFYKSKEYDDVLGSWSIEENNMAEVIMQTSFLDDVLFFTCDPNDDFAEWQNNCPSMDKFNGKGDGSAETMTFMDLADLNGNPVANMPVWLDGEGGHRAFKCIK